MSAVRPSAVWHPFTQHGAVAAFPEIVAGDGAALTLADGGRVIDAISSWWVTTHGHRHPRLMRALAEAAHGLDQVMFAGFTHAPAEELARRLVEIAPAIEGSPPLTRAFFSDSGSTAVEVGIKMALSTWRNRGEAKRTRIAVLEHGYHGDTVGTMSAGHRGVFVAAYEPLLYEVARLPFPHAGQAQATLDALDAAAAIGDLAAVLVEPLVLGAGGMLMYPPKVLADLACAARAHGALVIADEVMTGFGRTGTMFASEQATLVPDILCLGKGLTGGALPLAVTLATEAIFAAHLSTDRARMFFHSSSYTANPVACAVALENLAIWRDEPVMERVAALADAQAGALAVFAGDPRFADVRRTGTIAAFDLAGPQTGYLADVGPRLAAYALDAGVLLRPLGNMVYVMPPYCTSEAELARIYGAVCAFVDGEGRP
jgi:adenosylmethionine---8-amino-7-oxononanoate aminotransferase